MATAWLPDVLDSHTAQKDEVRCRGLPSRTVGRERGAGLETRRGYAEAATSGSPGTANSTVGDSRPYHALRNRCVASRSSVICAGCGKRNSASAGGHGHAAHTTAGTVAHHASRVRPADGCFRDLRRRDGRPLTVAPVLRPRRAMCVRHCLPPVIRATAGQVLDRPAAADALPSGSGAAHPNTDFELHRLSHGLGDAGVSRPTTRRMVVVLSGPRESDAGPPLRSGGLWPTWRTAVSSPRRLVTLAVALAAGLVLGACGRPRFRRPRREVDER